MKTPQRIITTAVFALAAALTLSADAATVTWSGGGTLVNSNWSNTANWAGLAAPGVNDDVKFFDVGTNALGVVNNIVDATTWTGSLQFGNTNASHATLIPDGIALNLTNASGLSMFSPADPGVAKLLTNIVTGAGALNISNAAALISLNQGSAASPSRATLDLAGLNTFNVSARALGLGSSTFPSTVAAGTRYGGQLFLARTNVISLSLTDTLANYQTSTSRTNAIEIVRGPGNNPGITCQLWLGQTNTIALDSLGCGMDKSGNNSTASSGLIAFNPAFTNNSPGAYVRGVGGAAATRVKWWSIGDGNASSSSSNGGRGTNDFSNGTVNLLVDVMSLGRECNAANTAWAGPHSGLLTFNNGVIDVNTIYAGNQPFTQPTSTPGTLGVINVMGAGALLKVNSALNLGYTTGTSATALKTSGILNIQGGTAMVNAITVGAVSTTNNIILNGGTLILSNTIASPAKGLLTLATTNSTLQLNVTGITNVVTTNLMVGGATNILYPASVAVFASYPKQITLIKYDLMSGTFNFGFGAGVLPASAPDAYLSNNVANKSIDLVLPTDPRPNGTIPSSYSGSPGDNVSFSVTPSGAAPLTYHWRNGGINVTDGATGNGSTNNGSTTPSLSITNAQVADSGNYNLVITNAYGSFTSVVAVLTISTGSIAPSITGPNNTTVIQGNDATLTATVSGVPVPYLQWQKSGVDILGENASSLTITNAQYPADQATYSIIATNEAGASTNSALLTVIVPPVITQQPTNSVVTNTQAASFTVVATGVPAPTYQWKKNGNIIANQTNATLAFASATQADIATYTVLVGNAAGSVTSSNATLTVNSTMSVAALSPANGATGICYDTPLAVTFDRIPALRKAGKIKIFNTTNSTTPVDTLDLSLNVDRANSVGSALNNATNVQFRAVGGISYTNYPVIITGTTAAIYPHPGVMTSNQTYYVTVDNGCFTDTNGAYFAGISATNVWRFTTKPAGPANATNLVVAADGTGDFVTVQGAVDFIPANNTAYTLVNIRNGTYTEIVCVQSKHNITFRGQDRNAARIAYANNNNMNTGFNSQQTCSTFRLNANDISIENLTVTNTTPQGGSQAFALQVGNGSLRFIALNTEFSSYQDTILVANSPTTSYFRDSLIQGDVDYIWGGGTMFFTNCEMRTIRTTGGYVTNPRAPAGSNGISFVNCSFTVPGPGYINSVFARAIGVSNGNTVLVNCRIDTNAYTGWNASDVANVGLNLRWWEYGNSNLAATAAVSFNGTQLASNDPNLTNARSASLWLYGWVPQLAPNILTNPVGQSIAAGSNATFSVSATGIPAPVYQWLKNGTNVPNETNVSLTISSAVVADSGAYSVMASNIAGSAVSSVATLTVTSLVATNATNILATVSGGSLNLAWPSDHTGWSLQAQTNNLNTGLGTNWVTLGYESTNAVSLPIDPANPSVFFRLFFLVP